MYKRLLAPPVLLITMLLLAIIGLGMLPPIAQNPVYHDFADKRVIFGIPYFWNVVSNLPFLFIGAYGLWQCVQNWHRRPAGVTHWIPLTLSAGIFLTAFGSAYYHYAPSNETLTWDRLPMTLMFMSLFSLLVYDYLGRKAGTLMFWVALPLGVASVLYWNITETAGHGDLRPYVLVQYFPILAAVVLISSFPGKAPYVRYILLLIVWYVTAKIFEHNDKVIYEALGFWSGHTIKHLLGAVGLIYAMKLLDRWYPEA